MQSFYRSENLHSSLITICCCCILCKRQVCWGGGVVMRRKNRRCWGWARTLSLLFYRRDSQCAVSNWGLKDGVVPHSHKLSPLLYCFLSPSLLPVPLCSLKDWEHIIRMNTLTNMLMDVVRLPSDIADKINYNICMEKLDMPRWTRNSQKWIETLMLAICLPHMIWNMKK